MRLFFSVILGLGLLSVLPAAAQYSRFIIRLKNKNGTSYSLGSPGGFLSAKAVARRNTFSIPVDSTDLPVVKAYLDSIRLVPNVTILNSSKWLNQVCVRTSDSAALSKISSFSFVKNTSPIAARLAQPLVVPLKTAAGKFEFYSQLPSSPDFATAHPNRVAGTTDFYSYGTNAGQVHIHEGEYLHNLGFHGEGITIAMLDAGYLNYLSNPAFDSIRLQNQILGTHDYVAVETSVNEDHYHGSMCLSTIAANEPGQMVGTAPKAKFWLLRTEDANSEYPVEEQNWVAAAEFADSAGADIITSSLGYSDFDDPAFSLSYAQRDGKTSIISIGANLAVKKGMLVTNSAGNSGADGGDAKYVLCPADADGVLSIGATDVSGTIASFSSVGPNGAGQLKPNVVSVGRNAVVANVYTGVPNYSNGTSFSNPNLCGLIACLWQAFPDFSNRDIKDAVQKSANRAAAPDNLYGYGIPNMRLAYQDLLQRRVIKNYQQVIGSGYIKAFPVPFSSSFSVLLKAPVTGNASLRLVDMNGKTVELKTVAVQQDNMYTISFSTTRVIARGLYTLQYADGKNSISIRVLKH